MFCFCGIVRTAIVFPLNIFITFLIAVLYLKINDLIYKETGPKFLKCMMYLLNFAIFAFLSLICDYGVSGFLFLVFLYCYFKKANWLILVLVLLFSGLINLNANYWIVSFLTMLMLLFVEFDKDAKRIIKKWWIFYVYYPLHFFIIMLIKYLL
jgi:hypothetical protein